MQEASRLGKFLHNRWVRLSLILDALILVVIVGVIIYNSTKTAVIVFDVTPIDATISINGDFGYTNNTYELHPGNYEISISHPDLDTKTFSVNLESHATTKIITFLSASGNFDFYEYEDNLASYKKLTSIASAEDNQTTDHDTSAESFLEKMNKIMSIFNVLPIQGYVYADPDVGSSTAGFTITKRQNANQCNKVACLLTNYYGSGFEDAVAEEIKKAGYSPMDYQIIYEEYINV